MLFLFQTLIAWRRFIIVAGLVVAGAAAVMSLMMPKWYRATASIFPPDARSGTPVFAEFVQNLSMPLLGSLGTGAAPETIYVDMLKSRRIGEQIIKEFNLMDVYGVDVIEQGLMTFAGHVGYRILVNGVIIVSFEDRDPERAAAVANRLITLLDEFNQELNITRAKRTKDFIRRQMQERQEELSRAESALQEFQEKNNALVLDDQLRSAMEIITQLTGQAISLETQMKILTHYASRNSAEFERMQREYDEVVAQLTRLKIRNDSDDEDVVRAFIPTLETVPLLALEMIRLKRKVEVESTIYTMLVKEHEKARIDEARDTPTLQVMDTAAVPNLRSRPNRRVLVLVGGVVGIGWSSLLALFVTAWREEKAGVATVRSVLAPVARDFSRLRRR